jgi:hypothetical protein
MKAHTVALDLLRADHAEVVRKVRIAEQEIEICTSRLDWDAEHNPGNIRDRDMHTRRLRAASADLARYAERRDNLTGTISLLLYEATRDDDLRYPVGQCGCVSCRAE